jgi:hypothetical protein
MYQIWYILGTPERDGKSSSGRVELGTLDEARARQSEPPLAGRAEGEGDGDGFHTDAERADIEPEIAAVGVVEPASGPGTDRHAQGRRHVDRAEHRSHDPGAEIFAHQDRVERHHRAIGKSEHQGEAVEAREVAGEDIKAEGEGLEGEPRRRSCASRRRGRPRARPRTRTCPRA